MFLAVHDSIFGTTFLCLLVTLAKRGRLTTCKILNGYVVLHGTAATSLEKLAQCRKVLGLAPCVESFRGKTKILANSIEHGYAKSFHVSFLVRVTQVQVVISNRVLQLYLIIHRVYPGWYH